MTKKQIKALADLYAAGVVHNAMACGAYAEGLTDHENELLADEVKNISNRMAAKRGDLGKLSLSYGTLDDLANFCKENF